MTVTVEFLGLARRRAGCRFLEVQAVNLGTALRAMCRAQPALVEEVIDQDRLTANFIASLNGLAFVRDPATPLQDGDELLILSADVGG